MNANVWQELLKSVSIDGKLYSIFDAVNLGGLIWYNPKTYKGPNPPKSWDIGLMAAKTAADAQPLVYRSGKRRSKRLARSNWTIDSTGSCCKLVQTSTNSGCRATALVLARVKHAFETYAKIGH